MPYLDTIEDDIARAKEILEHGKMQPEEVECFPENMRAEILARSGNIIGADIYAAYQILKSFVEEITRLHDERKALDEKVQRMEQRVAFALHPDISDTKQ